MSKVVHSMGQNLESDGTGAPEEARRGSSSNGASQSDIGMQGVPLLSMLC